MIDQTGQEEGRSGGGPGHGEGRDGRTEGRREEAAGGLQVWHGHLHLKDGRELSVGAMRA